MDQVTTSPISDDTLLSTAAAKRSLHAEIGECIRRARLESGLGQAECARIAGIDTSSMFRIEKSGQNLTVETLAKLALAIGVPMHELLIGVVPDPGILDSSDQ